MIDWLAGKAYFLHTSEQLPSGSVVSIDPNGEIEWKTNKRIQCKGSHDSTFTIRTDPSSEFSLGLFTKIEFSGNPVKFIQGHNIWGSSDLTGLAYEAITRALATLGLELSASENQMLFDGHFSLSRVDVNNMYSMGSAESVKQWLSSAELSARTRMGKGHFSGSTLYFQKKSTRWSLKFYSKGRDSQSHN